MGKRFEHDKGKKGYPLEIELSKGKHKWCGCGKTKKVPWCDGTCKGGKPVKFELSKKQVVRVCNCGLTKTPPYCDETSHEGLGEPKKSKKPAKSKK